jgi:hypothetical protein
LAVLFWLGSLFCSALAAYPSCHAVAALSWQSSPESLVLVVLFCLHFFLPFSACPFLPVQFCLSGFACPILPALSHSVFPILLILPGCLVLAVLSRQPCLGSPGPGSPVLAAFSGCPFSPVFSALFCLSYSAGLVFRQVLPILLACPVLPVLFCLSGKRFSHRNIIIRDSRKARLAKSENRYESLVHDSRENLAKIWIPKASLACRENFKKRFSRQPQSQYRVIRYGGAAPN